MAKDKEHFTYLMGAGASCGQWIDEWSDGRLTLDGLPLVSNMGLKIDDFIRWFKAETNVKNDIENSGSSIKTERSAIEKAFISNLEWLQKECYRNTSLDTYAKKLYHKSKKPSIDADYKRLKATLSCYFMLEQARKPVDLRYDNFFASILKNKPGKAELPDDVNILSWNYDSQLERSYSSFLKGSANHILSDKIAESLQLIPRKNEKMEIDPEKFSIVKMNGSAEAHIINNPNFHNYDKFPYFNKVNQDIIDKIMGWYEQYIHRDDEPLSTLLHFAWETEDPYPLIMKKQLLKVTEKTTRLVVIGYSFPYFNREIDKLILSNMKDLKQIIIQVPEKDGTAYKERILSMLPRQVFLERLRENDPIQNAVGKIPVRIITDTNQFHLPYEF